VSPVTPCRCVFVLLLLLLLLLLLIIIITALRCVLLMAHLTRPLKCVLFCIFQLNRAVRVRKGLIYLRPRTLFLGSSTLIQA
jgi:hypothetical protein